MKKPLVVAIALIASVISFGQEKKETKPETKFDMLTSKSGVIIKYVDSKINGLQTMYASPEMKVRKVLIGNSSPSYFFQITQKGQYSSSTASIEYQDLLEVNKAIKVLASMESGDISNPNYLENKFTTSDGFQVGYYVSGGKSVWFLVLEKYGSSNTVFVKSGENVVSFFDDLVKFTENLKNTNQ